MGNHIVSILLRKQKFKLRLSVNNYIPVLMYKFNTSRTYTGMVQWIFLSSFRSTNPANIDWERKTWRLKPWRFKQVDENATGERKEIAFIFQQKWNVWISFHKCQTRNKLAHDRELCNFKERRKKGRERALPSCESSILLPLVKTILGCEAIHLASLSPSLPVALFFSFSAGDHWSSLYGGDFSWEGTFFSRFLSSSKLANV